jgi:hypothetical protein
MLVGKAHSPREPRGSRKFAVMNVTLRTSGRASLSSWLRLSVASAALVNVRVRALVSCRILVNETFSIATV